MGKSFYVYIAFAVCALGAAGLLLFDDKAWVYRALPTVERISPPLIDGLERYCADHDGYPSSLEQLVPQYIKDIPVLPRGLTWSYAPYAERQRYGLSVKGDSPETYISYHGTLREWGVCD